jgi:hypothetical protein
MAMSFDIFFQTCRFGIKAVEKVNPFTGKAESVLSSEPLTASELRAVQAILDQPKPGGPDEHGCYVINVPDGGTAEVIATDLAKSCMVALRGMTPGIFQFLLDLLRAGNWVMIPATKDAVTITSSSNSVKNLPADFPKLVVCNSVDELEVLLSKGFGTWKKYRDQIIGE